MSFPYKLISFITDNIPTQVVFLRMLNVLMAASGIYIFYKFFRELGIKTYLVNVGLFVFAFLPLWTNVAANINYDNMVFLLTGLFFLYSSRLIANRKLDIPLVIKILTTGLFASLIKFTFLPLFLTAVLLLLFYVINRENGMRNFWVSLKHSLKHNKFTFSTWVWSILLIIVILLSGFRYGIPMLIHRTPIPNCSVLMEKSRCATNPVHGIEQRALETKDQRSTQLPSTYVQSWVNRMTRDYNITAVNTPDGTKVQSSPSIYSVALATGLACGILILIYMWRSMKLDSRYAFTILSSCGLLAATLLFNISTYYQYHADLNVQPRYALSILPVIIVFSVMAINSLLARHFYIKLSLFLLLMIVTTQGGGIFTHIKVSDSTWYWDNSKVQKIQNEARELISPLISD